MKYKYHLLTYLLIAVTVLSAHSCRKLYNPPALTAPNSYLVVEGAINSGADSTIIKLSRTVSVSAGMKSSPEKNAFIAVNGDQGASFPLTEIKPGTYAIASLNLDKTRKYRLSIRTSDGKQYASDFVPVVDSPPIDSISFDSNGSQASGAGVNIYVSTHDPANKVQYYRWDFTETWEFTSAFESAFYSTGDTVLVRNNTIDSNDIYHCWRSDSSSSILLGSTAKLSKSIVVNQPVNFIESTSEKVSHEYSILVRQYALSSGAYNFYTMLRKNTEQLGSIFDAQPSQLPGNIHCISNPSEPVLGYISAGTVSLQRIFIMEQQLPYWRPITYYTINNCTLASAADDANGTCCLFHYRNKKGEIENQVDEYINYDKGHPVDPLIPIGAILDYTTSSRMVIGYTAASRECTDCTLRGTDIKPAFWK
ncbi:MAG: DUF4249 domain-containing protein [Bacteroidetes bacterium]|nr:DUF4249 domain-containing protein [Bacteroidota bacterium]